MGVGKRPFLVVRAHVDPKVWEEFLEWHQRVHVPHMLKVPGIINAYRLRGGPGHHNCLMLYPFKDEAVIQEALSSAEAAQARSDWQHWLEHVSDLSVEVYAPLAALAVYHHRN